MFKKRFKSLQPLAVLLGGKKPAVFTVKKHYGLTAWHQQRSHVEDESGWRHWFVLLSKHPVLDDLSTSQALFKSFSTLLTWQLLPIPTL